jgi:hypothetical protein
LALGALAVSAALFSGVVAAGKGYSFGVFFALGLVFFPAALVIAVVLPDREMAGPRQVPSDAGEAIRGSAVAGALAAGPDRSLSELVSATGLGADRVERELRAMEQLQAAAVNEHGRWRLVQRGRAAFDMLQTE